MLTIVLSVAVFSLGYLLAYAVETAFADNFLGEEILPRNWYC